MLVYILISDSKNPYLITFLTLYLMFCLSLIQSVTFFLASCLLRFHLAGIFLSLLGFDSFVNLEELTRYFAYYPLIDIGLCFFFMSKPDFHIREGKPQKCSDTFITNSKMHISSTIYRCGWWPWAPSWGSDCQVSLLWVSLLSPI